MKYAAACAFLLLMPVGAGAAILQTAHLPPAGGYTRKAPPDRRNPLPAPATTHQYAAAPGLPPTWAN